MTHNNPHQSPEPGNPMPPAATGNASNPSAQDDATGDNQVLGAQAEKYLREGASIEDMPDDQDWQEAGETLRKEAGKD